ncbi:NUDIX hydrolase [Musicola keenii]|uniref:NUDIX hydrolase n=1 Tax=Musicola keenii TaxID=2884250 RepID=UPI001781F58E|nr:NUDIX domain-containing protein [Musicola keenii]
MRKRPASRLLVINAQLRVLLFRFEHKDDAMAGRAYWATPGGALEEGESFTQAAIRELWEETGLNITDPGEEIAQREFVMMMPNGKEVLADERYFIIRIQYHDLDCSQWTEHEKKIMRRYDWWGMDELRQTQETVYPDNLPALLEPYLSITR